VPFNINENSEIDARVDATVKLYDYYNPELQVATKYKVNKCQPNEIAPIPALPVAGNRKINNLTNDQIPIDNTTIDTYGIDEVDAQMNDINNTSEATYITKRQVQNYRTKVINTGLNPDFVNVDIELAFPNGPEANRPVYTKPENKQANGKK